MSGDRNSLVPDWQKSGRRGFKEVDGQRATSDRGTGDCWHGVGLNHMDGFIVVRHGISEGGRDWVVLMAGRVGVLLVAIFFAELDRIPGYAVTRTVDVLLRAVAEHGSGVLITDDARLDLFVDAVTVLGRRVAGSDVLRRVGCGWFKCFRLVGCRGCIFGPAARFRI